MYLLVFKRAPELECNCSILSQISLELECNYSILSQISQQIGL